MARKRKTGQKKPEKVMKILCEGAKTEPLYLTRFIQSLQSSERRFVVSVEPTKKNTPVQLVEEAVSIKKSNYSLEGDIYWVVYDRESVAKYSNELHAKAFQKAKRSGINIAISNVCFEYWLLLHLCDTSSPYSCYDNLLKESQFRKLFEEKTGFKYEKSNINTYDALKDSITEARDRAEALNKVAAENSAAGKSRPFETNPYTNVNELLKSIEDFK